MSSMRTSLVLGIFALLVFVPGIASAQNLNFSASVTSGDVANADTDIVGVSAHYDSSYQYFSITVRGKINTIPPEGVSCAYSVSVKTDNDDDYADIVVQWVTSNGETDHAYTYTIGNAGGFLSIDDITISGNTITIRVPAGGFQNKNIREVIFSTVYHDLQKQTVDMDTYTYNVQSGGGSSNGGGSYNTPNTGIDVGMFLWIALGIIIAIIIVIVIVVLLVVKKSSTPPQPPQYGQPPSGGS